MDMGLDMGGAGGSIGSSCQSCKSGEENSAQSEADLHELEELMFYDNEDVVASIKKEHHLNQDAAQQLFNDVKAFLWLTTVAGNLSPTLQIDKGWHEFLIFTKDYREFCLTRFGHFIDHTPRRLSDPPGDGSHKAKLTAAVMKYLGKIPGENWDWDDRVNAECTTVPSCRAHESRPSGHFSTNCESSPLE